MIRRSFLLALTSAAMLAGCVSTADNANQSDEDVVAQMPKNIIMVVADGMGPAFTTAYRNYQDDPNTPQVERSVLDDILVGGASTYPAEESGLVTDSAAAATALATGIKSYNGAIGVDVNKQPLESVMHRAKAQGMRTGLAVTSQIVHATPASYVAHNESRNNYNELAESFFDFRVNGEFVADVMLGGGTAFFEREDRDLVAEFIDNGYQYADSYNRLAAVPKGSRVLGLFAPVGLPPALDDTRRNRLSYLTGHAIKHLENDKGFFLLVEASQVDWAGHANDIASAMAEMHDLALTMAYLKDYVKQHPDTLVILTADHSTGGLTIGADGDYRWSPEYIRNLQASTGAIAAGLSDADEPGAYVASQLGFALTEEEKRHFDDLKQADKEARYTALKAFIDGKTNTGWTTSGHTGVDVEVFAFGAGANRLSGKIDNTQIAHTIFSLLARDAAQAEQAIAVPASAADSNPNCDYKTDWRCQ